MKMKLIMAGMAASMIGLASCGNSNSISPQQLAGTWKGETTKMTEPDMSCTPILTFDRTADTRGGRLDIGADFTITKELGESATKDLATATINGKASASGTWVIEDGDVKLILNPADTRVDIDTASLTLSYAHPSKHTTDSLSLTRHMIATNIAETMRPIVTAKIQKITEFDDVSVADNIMTLEIGNNMITFTKQ